MNGTTITRREAIKAGTDYLGLLLLALMAGALPIAEAAPVASPPVTLPGWMAEEPRIAAALSRIVAAEPQPGPGQRENYVNVFESMAGLMEIVREERG